MRTRETTDASGSAWRKAIRPERHRERILTIVRNRDLPLSLADLAELVVDQAGPSTPRSTRREEDVERARICLHHVDLPKLRDRGAIEYDPSNQVVSDAFEHDSE
jgi:hypothetical protein